MPIHWINDQQDPGVKGYRYYTIKDADSNNVGYVLVPKTTGSIGGTTYSAGTEYWFDVVNLTTMPRSLLFYWDDYEWTDTPPSLGTQSFTMPQAPTWSSSSTPSQSSSNFVDNNLDVVLGWQLTYSSGNWGGSLVWWNQTGQNTVFGGSATSPATLDGDTAPTRTSGWYTTSVSPS